MKNNRFNSVLCSAVMSSAIAMGLFASTGSAQAQTDPRVRANIPFAFQAGSIQMPAGVYDVSLVSDHLLQLRGQGPGKQASGFLTVIPSQGGKIEKNGRLVFHRYGDRYFLREVWPGDSDQGSECTPSGDEKRIVAQNRQAATQVQLAVNNNPKR